MILLLGSNGSMGRRYQAILNHLSVPYIPLDIGQQCFHSKFIQGTIIATPTETHSTLIKQVADYGPILCEKPICKSLAEMNETLDFIRDEGVKFTMMNQYSLLDDPFSAGHTHYDYYNTGKDGTVWDCMQIIGAARSTVTIKSESPIWSCVLNGKKISIEQMDHAYLKFVKLWLEFKPLQTLDYIREMHYKVREYELKN